MQRPPALRSLFLPLALVGAVLIFLTGCASGPGARDVRDFHTVVIDAGHGGHDSGAISHGRRGGVVRKGRKRVRVASVPRLREKDINLNVAKKVEAGLKAHGFQTVMTRRDDRFIPLDTRAAISNQYRKSVFLSIHFNHSPKRHVHGAEVYHNDKGTALFSKRILRSLDGVPGISSRFVKTANFRVLRKSDGPAILVESAYLSNHAEAVRCMDPAYQQQIADAIVQAVADQRHPAGGR